jgi:hypothetical protein
MNAMQTFERQSILTTNLLLMNFAAGVQKSVSKGFVLPFTRDLEDKCNKIKHGRLEDCVDSVPFVTVDT